MDNGAFLAAGGGESLCIHQFEGVSGNSCDADRNMAAGTFIGLNGKSMPTDDINNGTDSVLVHNSSSMVADTAKRTAGLAEQGLSVVFQRNHSKSSSLKFVVGGG